MGEEASNANSPDPVALQMAGSLMLHSATAIGDVKRMAALLSAGIDANAQDDSGVSPLEKACVGGNLEAAKILLDRGANVNGIETSPTTPLHRAIAAGPKGRRLVQLLCDRGARRTEKDSTGRTPADLAREMGLEPLPELR